MIEYSYYLVTFNKTIEIFDDLTKEQLDLLIKNNLKYIKAVHKVVKGSDIKRNIYLYESWMYNEFDYTPDKLIVHNRNLAKNSYGDVPMEPYDCELVKFLYNNHKNNYDNGD